MLHLRRTWAVKTNRNLWKRTADKIALQLYPCCSQNCSTLDKMFLLQLYLIVLSLDTKICLATLSIKRKTEIWSNYLYEKKMKTDQMTWVILSYYKRHVQAWISVFVNETNGSFAIYWPKNSAVYHRFTKKCRPHLAFAKFVPYVGEKGVQIVHFHLKVEGSRHWNQGKQQSYLQE